MLNLAVMAIFGAVIKIYDDLDELYLSTDRHTLALLQCIQTMIICLWLFVLVVTKYDVLLMFDGCIFGIFDWEAYSSDPFFYALTVCVTGACIAAFMLHGWSFVFYELFLNYTVGFFLTAPLPEIFCIKMNGAMYKLAQWLNWAPKEQDSATLVNISEADLEVSHFKLKIRIYSVIYLIVVFCLMQYLRTLVEIDGMWYNLLTTWSCMNMCFIFYFGTSVYNQYDVLYRHPEIVEKHHGSTGSES
jgi:hypothetical protein